LIGVAIAHDQTVSALRDSDRRFRGILESALDGIVTTDDQGVILEFNSAAETIFGVTRRRAIGAKIRDAIIPERLRTAHDAGMARYLSTGDSRILNRRIEVTPLRGDDEFPAELTVTSTEVAGRTLFTAHAPRTGRRHVLLPPTPIHSPAARRVLRSRRSRRGWGRRRTQYRLGACQPSSYAFTMNQATNPNGT
jgi:PAS domain S-box-containing protein